MLKNLAGQRVVVGFSGGPDAAAIAFRLRQAGAIVLPVYINYRKTAGGKTSKDLRAAYTSAELLGIQKPKEVRVPLGNRPKSHRNRFFVKALAAIARDNNSDAVALGTIKKAACERNVLGRATFNDLDPEVLARHGNKHGVRVITWDSFGVSNKADEFKNVDEQTREAIFQTTSCQMWWRLECGNCGSCVARHHAFMDAFAQDPTPYRPNSRVGRETQQHRR